MELGRVLEIWRYPVKSLGGESITAADIVQHGLSGDRHWTVYDPVAPMLRSAKQWPALLTLQASYHSQPKPDDTGDAVAGVRLSAPDGSHWDSSDRDGCDAWLSRQLGKPAQLRPRAPAYERGFYALPAARTMEGIAMEIGLEEGEPLPDFQMDDMELATALAHHATPPGFLYDAYPLHILTTDSLAFLAQRSGLDTDVRRFRPNLLLDMDQAAAAQTEQGWLGRMLAIGSAIVRIHSPTSRCAMPSRPQPGFGLAAEPGLTRAMACHVDRNLGVNAQVVRPGRVEAGDTVRLLSETEGAWQ